MTNLSLGVLLLPLLGFVILGLFGRFLSRSMILAVAWGACGLAFVLAAISFLSMLSGPAVAPQASSYLWVATGTTFQVSFGQYFDPLSATMLMVVTGVGLLIHIYSAGYMEDDPSFWRFFAYLNFFIFAMVLLVTANSFLFLLMGWGLVGLASFLLIGFWYQRRSALEAARKAFVINVIGDFGLMLAIFLIFGNYQGHLDFQYVFANVSNVTHGSGTATAICLLLFLACAAKSAQLPLYMWLPDAMEGPTPVSALIHAATMVTAGVYLVARTHLLFDNAPVALNVVAGIGGVTALFAATIALFQLDIKRVLAYSTVSQLGYMFLAEGVHNYSAGVFHLVTHAYFKALLFLGAGAVIHALGGEQDMRKMGGLRSRMPITFWTFLIAALAISGIPPLAGFWSKDEIIGSLLGQATGTGNIWYYLLWIIALLTAALTAFYMFRLFFAIFLGQYRGNTSAVAPVGADHDEDEAEETTGHHAGPVSYYHIHEVPAGMWVPLAILAFLSVVGGLVGIGSNSPFEHFLSLSIGRAPEISAAAEWISLGLSVLLAVLGIALAWRRYGRGFAYKENRNPLYQLVLHKYYVDEILDTILIKPLLAFGRLFTNVLESFTLDKGSQAIASLFRGSSGGLRRLQTGYVRNYALGITFGVVLIIVYYIVFYAVRG